MYMCERDIVRDNYQGAVFHNQQIGCDICALGQALQEGRMLQRTVSFIHTSISLNSRIIHVKFSIFKKVNSNQIRT